MSVIAQVSFVQTIVTLFSAGIIGTIGYAIRYVVEQRKAEREARNVEHKDTIGEWQAIAARNDLLLVQAAANSTKDKADIIRALGLISTLRTRLTRDKARVAILSQALGLQREGYDPFVVQQVVMRAQAVIVTKPDGEIIEAAPNIIAIIDYTDKELLRTNVSRLIPERKQEQHREFMDRARDLSIPFDHKNVLPLILIARDGQEQPVNVRIGRTEEGGKVVRFSVLVMERDLEVEDINGSSRTDMIVARSPEAGQSPPSSSPA